MYSSQKNKKADVPPVLTPAVAPLSRTATKRKSVNKVTTSESSKRSRKTKVQYDVKDFDYEAYHDTMTNLSTKPTSLQPLTGTKGSTGKSRTVDPVFVPPPSNSVDLQSAVASEVQKALQPILAPLLQRVTQVPSAVFSAQLDEAEAKQRHDEGMRQTELILKHEHEMQLVRMRYDAEMDRLRADRELLKIEKKERKRERKRERKQAKAEKKDRKRDKAERKETRRQDANEEEKKRAVEVLS